MAMVRAVLYELYAIFGKHRESSGKLLAKVW